VTWFIRTEGTKPMLLLLDLWANQMKFLKFG